MDEARRRFHAAALRMPTLATDVPYVRVELAPNMLVSDDDLSSLGLVPVYRREATILAAYSPERDFRTLANQLTSYAQLKKKLAVLAKIQTIKAWSREDRTSARLRDVTIIADDIYTVDLLMMAVEGDEPNPQAARAVEAYVVASRGRVVDRALGATFAAMRVRMGGQALDDMLEYRDDIAFIDLPPAARVIVPEVLSLKLDDLPEVESPASTAPAVCVVDSGILEGHPLLGPAIIAERSRSFPMELGPPIPRAPVRAAGHGTQVAGIALYGDVDACAHAKSFAPALRVINARMLDDNNELHPDRMPFLRDIVEHVADACRVVNLSFGLEPHDGFLSVHAAELDGLARERGVLFVVSAGNVRPSVIFGGAAPNETYPEFMLADRWRVLAPAEALNALTVGGITPDRDPFTVDLAKKVVAPKRAPSPFSCSGGIKNVVKPELVEVAGNLAYDHLAKVWIENEPGLRIATTSPRFATDAMLGMVHGSSFSSPRVANLAATLLSRYADATPNLLRALLIQSARLPEGVREWEPTRAMRLCGFGVPDLDRALYCRPHRATLFYEGEIAPDEVKLFDIPVPEDFAKTKGRKAITVTVAYDPPVSVVHRDRPAGVSLTWRLARGDVPEKDVESAIAAEAEREGSDTAPTVSKGKSPFRTGDLPKRAQQRGTVQKDVFSWKRGVYGDTYRLAIIAKAVRPAHAQTQQRFAVVVSIETEDSGVNVFNLVRARLASGRVRVRVPAP
jgi:hypothetical protein